METINISAPEFELATGAGFVEVSFEKNDADAVNIYRRLEGDNGWTFVATDTHPPYIDNSPPKALGSLEDRDYMLKPVVNGEEINQESAIKTILYSG